MASPTVVEVKLSKELKSLCDRIPENMADRLAEVERVLIELCGRNGIAFYADPPKREQAGECE